MHHRGTSSSPITVFDTPSEFPPLIQRRLKPLPKRRRTYDLAQVVLNHSSEEPLADSPDADAEGEGEGDEDSDVVQRPPMPDFLLDTKGHPSSLTDALIARAESFSSRVVAQSYYRSVFGGGGGDGGDITLARGSLDGVGGGGGGDTDDQLLLDDMDGLHLSTGSPHLSMDVTAPQSLDLSLRAVYHGFRSHSGKLDEDRDQGQDQDQDQEVSEGDYTDHLQQPGNTKKRKVPANMSGSIHGREGSLPLSGEEEEEIGDGVGFGFGLGLGIGGGFASASAFSTGGMDPDLDILVAPLSSQQQQLSRRRKGKMSPSTLAGLQHKELLKHRKRQLAAVLGALSLGDALALDQALSTHLPFVSTMFGSDASPPKVRLSRRRGPRLARAAAAAASARKTSSSSQQHMDGVPFPTTQFTFSFPSATSDRLIATKAEVLALRSRFEAELARQAARAAKAAAEAKQAALAASRASRSKRSNKISPSSVLASNGGDQFGVHSDVSSPSGGKNRGNKKKKRNALAIASNPHHRNNYVPSRFPSSGHVNPTQSTQNAQNLLGPLPLRFLSAELPPRRRRKDAATAPRAQIVDPGEEWICPRCEYLLFFGDSAEYRRAVRGRKQILRRRRRAQERAAGGLNGPRNAVKPISDEEGEEEEDNDDDQSAAQSPVIAKSTVTEWREGPDIRTTKGQSRLPSG